MIQNYDEDLPLKPDRNLLKILFFLRILNVVEKNRNLTFFVIYFCEIYVLPLSWDH